MILFYLTVGNPPKRHYYIETDKGDPIGDFDNLYTAAIVLRFLKGSNMDIEERAHARAALLAFDPRKEKEGDTF